MGLRMFRFLFYNGLGYENVAICNELSSYVLLNFNYVNFNYYVLFDIYFRVICLFIFSFVLKGR